MTFQITFQQALSQGTLIFDGAMGTELYRHHVFTNRCFDELCLSDAKLIRTIHGEYRDAGADVLTTNTFGANRVSLAHFGLAEKVREINRGGASIAREVADSADRPMFVAGSIGPLPIQPRYENLYDEMIAEQAKSLMAGGADFILFETQPTRKALEICAAGMRACPHAPYVLSFALLENGESASGEPLERMLAPLSGDIPQPIAWGMNCGIGPDGLLAAVERAVRLTALPLIVQPNAGMPKEVDNRRIYLCSPEYLTEYAKRYVSLGVSAVGGCCGTTPDHIRELAATIKPLTRMQSKPVISAVPESVEQKSPAPSPKNRNSAIASPIGIG